MKQLKQLVGSRWSDLPLAEYMHRRRSEREVARWERNGRPAPPPHAVKQRALRGYAAEFGLRTLVETGTYRGDMVKAMLADFDRIYSIELSEQLHRDAKRRFRKAAHVELIQGDSGKVLGTLMRRIDAPALFWLDGHYSAGVTAKGESDTPIFEELRHIFDNPDRGHVILIDDARLFGVDPAYPSLEELTEFVRARRERVAISVQEDSIRIVPAA